MFQEYFFSRKPLYEYEKKIIINSFFDKVIDKNSENEVLCLMNFLYRLSTPLNDEQKKELNDYLAMINGETKIFNLKPFEQQCSIREDAKQWFTNQSYMVYNGKVIFSQKKQAYSNEVNILKFNFSLGFGNKETKLKTNEPEYRLFKYLNSIINLDICLDIHHKYSFNRKKYMTDSISYLDAKDKIIINKKREIFAKYNDGSDYEDKDFYIVQSNSTNINECLMQFPNKKIIIQVDPLSSGIFRTNYTEAFSAKINDIKNHINSFYNDLSLKNNSFIKDSDIDKDKQEIEFSRTKNRAEEEIFNDNIEDLYNKNFYNIVELIKPKNSIFKEIGNIKLTILTHDLKEIKFD